MSSEGGGLIGKLARWRRAGTVAVLISGSPLLAGCFGHFPVTRAVWEFNNGIPSGILRNLVFWAFLIIPVYSIATVVDAVVLNVFEFWLPGRIDDQVERTLEDGKTVVTVPSEDGREATLTVRDGEEVVLELRLVKISDEMLEIRDMDGALLGGAQMMPTGDAELTDAAGQIVRSVSASDLAQIVRG